MSGRRRGGRAAGDRRAATRGVRAWPARFAVARFAVARFAVALCTVALGTVALAACEGSARAPSPPGDARPASPVVPANPSRPASPVVPANPSRPASPVPLAEPTSPAEAASGPPRGALPEATAVGGFFGLEGGDDAWMARIGRAQAARFRPIGTSSLVFKVFFTGGLEAAFRPRTHGQSRGWLNEVAAYRIARALGMDQVPPAVSRTFTRRELRGHLDADYGGDWTALDADLLGRGDAVWGALVYWVPGLRDLELDRPSGLARARPWLAQDGAPAIGDEVSLAADLATMQGFDYLLANVDRWSGGNVRADASGRRVVIRDHNLALISPLPRAQHERVLGRARGVERFSRRFVMRLRALDEAGLRAAFAADPAAQAGFALLDEAQLRGVLDRRAALLSRVGALIAVHGEDAVLAFP